VAAAVGVGCAAKNGGADWDAVDAWPGEATNLRVRMGVVVVVVSFTSSSSLSYYNDCGAREKTKVGVL
jgi:hypothetical protein